MSYKKFIESLAERFPDVKKISVQYYGSGDSFDSFDDITFETKDGSPYQHNNWNDNCALLNENEMNGLLWDALERSGADCARDFLRLCSSEKIRPFNFSETFFLNSSLLTEHSDPPVHIL